jgi:hypothetical protein
MSNEDLLSALEEAINDVRVKLDAVVAAQDDSSDVGNADHLDEAAIALDNFEMNVSSIVP